mgnify:FL=1
MEHRSHGAGKGTMLAALLTAVFVMIVGIDAYHKTKKQPGPPSTYNAASGGYKALYLWLRSLGVPAERWERPLTELPQKATVLLMISPRLGPGPHELKALETWVRGGGSLVLISSPWNAFAKHFGFEMGTGSLAQRKQHREEILFSQPGPYVRGRRTIRSKTHFSADSGRPEAIVHARDAFGNLIVAVEEGRGRVMLIADPSLLTNLHLREGDHARLALDALLSHLGEGALLIDEYHHGYGRVTSVASYLHQSGAVPSILQMLFLFLLLWAAEGRRFGPPRPLRTETARSSLEYVRAVAHLFQRVKARRLALERVLRWFEAEARRLLLERDPAFRKDRAEAKKQVLAKTMTDRELVSVVRKLYGALARARKGRA